MRDRVAEAASILDHEFPTIDQKTPPPVGIQHAFMKGVTLELQGRHEEAKAPLLETLNAGLSMVIQPVDIRIAAFSLAKAYRNTGDAANAERITRQFQLSSPATAP